MIDNKRNNVPGKVFSDLHYELQVKIYDSNCANCPFSLIKVRDGLRLYRMASLQDAINEVLSKQKSDISILRMCSFGGDEYSLKEITSNTCSFWIEDRVEGGSENPDNAEDAFVEWTVAEFQVAQTLKQRGILKEKGIAG